MTQKQCTVCRLPEAYPGISFDEQGVCSVCRRTIAPEKPYLGLDALKKRIAAVLSAPQYAKRPYDAAIAFSGGRDSSYLLYYAKQVLGLKVLAITLSHTFMPDETFESIENICRTLNVDLHVIKNEALDQYSTQCVQAWARKPEAATLVTFCTGCRYGIKRLIPSFCKEVGIPLLLVGNTRMEQMSYRQDLLSIDQRYPTMPNKAVGYLRSILQNPGILGTPRCACVQAYEFAYPLARKVIKNKHVTVLAPFLDYEEVSEEHLTNTLHEIGWRHNACFKSEWRADCYVNILRQYFYQKILGFSDLDVHYADLLRAGEIDLPTAIGRRAAENQFDKTLIADLLKTYYQLDLQEILAKLPAKQA